MTSLVDITIDNYPIYLDRIIEIENQSFPSPWSIRVFKEEIKNPLSHLWVLMVNESVTGYTCFRMFDNKIQLTNIAVLPHSRGKGIGHYLVTKLIEAGISKGMKSIWLEVRPSNSAAKRLYQKSGFEEVGKTARYYRDTNEDAIIMALTLSEKVSRTIASN